MRVLPAAVAALGVFASSTAMAADDLLETLAQKGVITMEEYQKLKAGNKGGGGVTFNADDGLKIGTADGAFAIQVGALQQLDFAAIHDDISDNSDGTQYRRSRISVAGTLFEDFQFRVEYEFSGTTAITDSYIIYNGLKPFQVEVGQFKQPFGLEALMADKNGTFQERGLPFAFLITRAPGLMLSDYGTNWSVAGGVFGEPVGNATAGDEGYAFVGRATYAPWLAKDQVVHLGIGISYRDPTDDTSTNTTGTKTATLQFSARPETNQANVLATTGLMTSIDTYTIEGFELAGAYGPASIQAEYQRTEVKRKDGLDTLHFSGWYVYGAYTLTGESRPYKADKGVFEGIRPRSSFAHDGGWGAWEVALRGSQIDLTSKDKVGGTIKDITAGVNWYLNQYLRVTANYVKTISVHEGKSAGDTPSIFETRFQLAF